MGFGFVVARFGLFLREIAQVGPYVQAPRVNAGAIGVALVVVGVLVNIGASLRYRRIGMALERGEAPRISLSAPTLVALVAAGAGIILAVLLVIALV
jgi:putative membrane protein